MSTSVTTLPLTVYRDIEVAVAEPLRVEIGKFEYSDGEPVDMAGWEHALMIREAVRRPVRILCSIENGRLEVDAFGAVDLDLSLEDVILLGRRDHVYDYRVRRPFAPVWYPRKGVLRLKEFVTRDA